MEPLVINVQKCSIHDGPGIRTSVFFKGCPLECKWCHNPESQNFGVDFMYDAEKCSLCGACIDKCHNKAIYKVGDTLIRESRRCDFCGVCIDWCQNNAREFVGECISRKRLVKEIAKDIVFYDESGGGVTLSGGEVMCQDIDYLEDLIDDCKLKGISVAIDTCGYAPRKSFERLVDKVDLFLYDIKLLDSDMHKQYTGKSNNQIIENLIYLSSAGANINIRIPIIGGVNVFDASIEASKTTKENLGYDENKEIMSIVELLKGLKISKVNLLPYHDIMLNKYTKLGIAYKGEDFYKPSDEKMNEILEIFQGNKFNVKIGG